MAVLTGRSFARPDAPVDDITARQTIKRLVKLHIDVDSPAAPLAVLAVQGARAVDAAAAKGSAAALAQASRELRETLAAVEAQVLAEQPEAADPFEELVKRAAEADALRIEA
jgi:hypothetical protein